MIDMTAAMYAEELTRFASPLLAMALVARALGGVPSRVLWTVMALTGPFVWALAPRCLCSDDSAEAVGSVLVAGGMGAILALMLVGACRMLDRYR